MSVEYGRKVIDTEIAALQAIRDRLDGEYEKALDLMLACNGRIVTCGMGKAGIIAQKIAATMASTGSQSFYMHPADALHGDLGMVGADDVVLILSNSGESEEVTRLLPGVRCLGAKIIAITATMRSTLAAHADIALLIGEIEEACPLGLAPTATTTAMLALGDAIALCLMQRRDFKVNDYALRHPAGALGRKTLPVEDLMRVGEAVAKVTPDTPIRDVILAITNARAGAAMVVDADGKFLGIFTDGDLRRGIEEDDAFLQTLVGDVMVSSCSVVKSGTIAGEVLDIMREKRIADVPIVDESGTLLGVADLKGLVASL